MDETYKMNIETGQIRNMDDAAFRQLPPAEQRLYTPIQRDLTTKEKSDMQIRLYAPCGCGSGKKFKFCCHNKFRPKLSKSTGH